MGMSINRKLNDLFIEDSDYLEIFHIIKTYIESLGEVRMKSTRSQISFPVKNQFAWIWLPTLKLKDRPAKYIVLSFSVGNQIMHEKIVESVEPYPGRWMHHVIVQNKNDFSNAVPNWLKEEYRFGMK